MDQRISRRMPETHKLISICVPVFNEEQNISPLYDRLLGVIDKIENYSFQIIFSDNHSTDNTWGEITKIAESDSRIVGMKFSRNFGFQNSVLAAILESKGDAVIQIDADLQDPPELFSDFLQLWESGYKVVYGIRKNRPESFFLRGLRNLGYRVVNYLSEFDNPRNAGDFRLIDNIVVEELRKQNQLNPYLRGQIASFGFKSAGVEFSRDERKFGQSKFPLKRIITLGMTGILNHSFVPLRLATYLGIVILSGSFAGIVFYTVSFFTNSAIPRGFTTTQLVLLFSLGINSMLLGVLGEYILRIYRIVRRDPLVIIEERIEHDN